MLFLSQENAVSLCYILPYEKIGKYLETPKYISGELHKPVETLPDAKGARRFARAWAQKQWMEGTRRKPLLPNSAISWPDLPKEVKTVWTFFLFLKKASYIVVWGFSMSWKRFSEFQAFWLTGNRNGNGNKKWNGTQVSTDWTHMGVTAYWISTTFIAVKTPGAEISKTHFFHSRGFFHTLPQSDPRKRSSPLPPYFKSWPFSFCSSWFLIFSWNWDFGGKYAAAN